MDLTPELLVEAKFAPARRGYDMREVDDFLERCAEGLDVLLDRLKAEFLRAEQAEAQVLELRAALAEAQQQRQDSSDALGGAVHVVPPPEAPFDHDSAPLDDTGPSGAGPAADAPVDDPSVDAVAAPPAETAAAAPPTADPVAAAEPMRILIAAERTAEAAVAEARSEAERIRSEAAATAEAQTKEAEALLTRSKAEAEAEARKAGEETRRLIETEVVSLRRDRDALTNDVRSLRRWLDEQRTRMRTAARDLQRLVDDPAALRDLPVPELAETDEDAAEQLVDGDAEPNDELGAGDGLPADADLDDPELESDGPPTQAVPTIGTDPDGDDSDGAGASPVM